MADQLIDVYLEFDPTALAGEKDPTQTIAEASHHAARAVSGDGG